MREGAHLICELPLTFPQVALGDEVEVPVLDGTAKLKVPAGTQPGQRLVLPVEQMHLEIGSALRQVVRRAHPGRTAADDGDRTSPVDARRDLVDA